MLSSFKVKIVKGLVLESDDKTSIGAQHHSEESLGESGNPSRLQKIFEITNL